MFVACRVTNNPMDLVDILKATGTGQKDISKFYKRMKSILPGAQLSQTSSKYAEDAGKKLGLEKEIITFCQEAADNISKLEILTGKKPSTIAGVAIYMIVRRIPKFNRIGCLEISNILGIGEIAIKNAYKEVEDLESDILPITFI